MKLFPRAPSKPAKREASQPSRIIYDILGIILVTLSLLLFLSVWSYSDHDVGWFSPAVSDVSPPHNLIGVVGATMANGLLWLFGMTAYVLPFLITLHGIRLFQKEPWAARLRSVLGSIVFLFCFSAWLEMSRTMFGNPEHLPVAEELLGGRSGQWIAGNLHDFFADTGSLVLLTAGLLVSLLLIRPFSVAAATGQIPTVWGRLKEVMPRGVFNWDLIEEWWHRPKANKPVKINRGRNSQGGTVPYSNPELEELESTLEFEELGPHEQIVVTAPGNKQPFEMTRKVSEGYHPPDPRALLEPPATIKTNQTDQILETQSSVLSSALQSFGISGKVTEVHPGPVITMYEFEPGPGIKVARIVTLAHDLAMALKATSVRIVAPLPGKSTVGIEVPNQVRETVSLREVLTSEHFSRSRSKLALALGKDIFGRPFVADLRTMPHVLVAGATGAGKSVGLNSMLLSILFSAHPDEVKLLLIDPKVLELQVYDGIPHLLRPVLTNPKAAARGLTWVVQEMERRYRLLAEHGVRNIQSYNLKVAHMQEQAGVPHAKTQTGGGDASSSTEETTSSPEPLPYIVVVIDEFADLMMVAPKEIEEKIARLAQMARASGIHLILATQRPSVDVVTGLIKANFPARIAFQVSSKIDSRTILDANGAEALLGMGDMLYLPPGTGRLTRLHGSFVSDEDVRRVVEYVKAQAGPDYSQDATGNDPIVSDDDESRDEVFEQAREVVLTSGQASASLIQRRLRVGYPRAARMIEQMEDEGLVSAPGRDGRREVLGPRGTIQEGVR